MDNKLAPSTESIRNMEFPPNPRLRYRRGIKMDQYISDHLEPVYKYHPLHMAANKFIIVKSLYNIENISELSHWIEYYRSEYLQNTMEIPNTVIVRPSLYRHLKAIIENEVANFVEMPQNVDLVDKFVFRGLTFVQMDEHVILMTRCENRA